MRADSFDTAMALFARQGASLYNRFEKQVPVLGAGWMDTTALRVLIVDDDAATRFVYQQVLEVLGLSLYEAASGDEAIRALNHTAPDLVVLDMLLPGVPGTDVLSHIYRAPHLADTRVLIITAHHSWTNLNLRDGDRILYKPVSPRHMREAAQDALQLPPAS